MCIDYSSAFNTIAPSNLVITLETLGLELDDEFGGYYGVKC